MTEEAIRNAFQDVHQALPISLAATAIIGLVLWLMGRKMIRPAMAICGVFIGAAIGFALSNEFQTSDGLLMTWTGVGAVAGALAVWLMYRAWMAISLGLLAIVVVPATAIAFTGTPDPAANPFPDPSRNAADTSTQLPNPSTFATKDGNPDAKDAVIDANVDGKDDGKDDAKDATNPNGFLPNRFIDDQAKQAIDDAIDEGLEKGKEVIGAAIEDGKRKLMKAIRGAFDNQFEYIEAWWESMDDGQQKSMLTTTAIGVGIALLIGFMFPNITASIETAFIGTILLFIALRGILASYSDSEINWLPSEPRQIFITVGLITLLGMLLQWTFFRKAADK